MHRQNGFDLLRLIAAALVIYGHAFPLTGTNGPGFLANGIQTIAVKVFFAISGFLICRSWLSDPQIYRYIVKRVLRIAPALILIVLITILLLGPIYSRLSLMQYLLNKNTWNYLWNLVLYPVYGLPGVFENNIYPNAINGSLWSLPVEVAMYISIPIILGKRLIQARVALPIAVIILLSFSIYHVRISNVIPKSVIYGTSVASMLDVCPYFQIGAIYAAFNLDKYARPLFSSVLLLMLCSFRCGGVLGELALLLALPFFAISVGTTHIKFLDKILRGNDISYGLYLFGFPIQQIFQFQFENKLSPYMNFVLSLAISTLFAVMSWFLIEKRALALKPSKRLAL